MTLDTINRGEFERRLEQSTARMRQQRLDLEARAAELEDLIGRSASVLERIEAEGEQNAAPYLKQRDGVTSYAHPTRGGHVSGCGGAVIHISDEEHGP